MTSLWKRLWAGICELEKHFDDRLVFIGGVAVYLHVKAAALPSSFIEYSHDGDFYISLADFSELRDAFDVTPNPRLSKYQLIQNNVDFDIYLERNASLIVSYEDVAAFSVVVENVRVASLEHLLLLKLDAFRDRQKSSKGGKDARDLVRIVYLLSGVGVDLKQLSPYLTAELFVLLESIAASKKIFLDLCKNNAHHARLLRERFAVAAREIAKAL